ncbi:MAG: hypothetical protein WC670_19385, partial [Pseudolabrys sp.]
MATLNIEGKTVQVDDAFLKLSPDEQNRTVDEIASTLRIQAAPAEPISTTNVVRAAARGVPIVGGLVDKAEAATEAALSYPVESLMRAAGADPKGPDMLSTEPTFGGRFSKALKLQQAKDVGFDTAHPVASTAAKIGGGVASLGGVMLRVPGAAKVLGAEGTMPQMIGRGAASGAALSAADAAARGESPVTAAEEGAVLGAAGGPVGKAIGKAVSAGREAFRGKPPMVPSRTVPVAGVDVPLPNPDPVAASKIEIARRGGAGEPAQRLVQSGDEATQAALERARSNIGASLSADGTPALAPVDAAEAVATEIRNLEAQRFGTEQAMLQRAEAETAATRAGVAGGAPLVESPEAAAEQVSARLRAIERERAATVEATRQRTTAGTEALRADIGRVDPAMPPAILADSPGAAAERVGAGVTGRARAARDAFKRDYDAVKAMDSEFAPGAFRNVSETVRGRLSAGDNPVLVDQMTTPQAAKALEDLHTNVGLGNFENLAAPPAGGAPGAIGAQSDAAAAAAKLAEFGVPPERAQQMVARLPGGEPPTAGVGSPPASALAPHEVAVSGGGAVSVAPKVVEASTLRTSADKGYNPALQPRDRTRAASSAQVRDMSANLNPSRLGASAEADRGAPIIGPDGMVESGNARVMALRQAYAEGGPAAARYRAWLEAQGADVAGLKEPVLVRERTTPMDAKQRQAFTVAANQSSTLSMSAAERALADSRLITPSSLSLIKNPGDLGAVENRDFVRSFVQGLPQTEQGAMLTARGDLSAEGLTRVRNAVLGKAYGDTPILSRIAESTSDEVKSISNALVSAAPEWAAMRSSIAAGRVPAELDATGDLLDAVSRTARIRAKGIGLADSRAQADAFTQQSPESELIQRMFYAADGEKAAPASQVASALRNYAQEASKVDAAPGLGLGLPPVTKADILSSTAAKVGAPTQLARSVTEAAEKTAAAAEVLGADKRVDLNAVDAARKRLVSLYQNAKDAAPRGESADTRATRRILHEFDQFVLDTVDSPAYRGDAAALETLRRARSGVAEYHRQFSPQGRGDEVGRAVEKILGRFPGQQATPDQIAAMSYGSKADPGGAQSVKVSQRLRQILGPTSPEWGTY